VALIKLGGSSRNRIVLLTVGMVTLAGLFVSTASYVHTRSLANSYNSAMQKELQQKGLAYGQTAQSLYSSFAQASPQGFQIILSQAASDPASLISQFTANERGQFQNKPLAYEAWLPDASAPGGYKLLLRQDLQGGRAPESSSDVPALVVQTADTLEPATHVDAQNEQLHYTFLITLGSGQSLIVVATLDASEEFAFIAAQRQRAIRDAIIFAASSVAFVSLVGAGLSMLVSRNLTNRKRAEEALRDSELRYRTLANMSPVGIFRNDRDGNNLYGNKRAEEILGAPPSAMSASAWATSLHPDDRDRVLAEWEDARTRGRDFRSEYRFVRPDRTAVWLLGAAAIERNIKGEIIGYVGTITDISEQKRLQERLREQARRDRLTGALNHGAIVDELQWLLSSAKDAHCAVAMVDIDNMKAMNDTYGHQMGDQTLQKIAQVLQQDGAIVGRYGGDEFIAILPGADREAAERYRQQVLRTLAEQRLDDPDTQAHVPLSATIGMSIYPDEAETIVDLIKLADSAMYGQRRDRPISPGARPRRSPADDRAAQMVGEIVPLLTSPGEIDAKLHFVTQRLLISMGYDAVTAVMFAPPSGGTARSATVARVDEQLIRRWDEEQTKGGEPTELRLLLEKLQRPFIIDDLAADERLAPDQRELLRRAQLHSGVVVPMVWQGQTLGALAVGSRQQGAFAPADARLLNTVCAQVTAIVRMSLLLDELQHASARLTESQEETVILLAAAAEAHDHTTGQHLHRVQELVRALALELGYSEAEAKEIGLAAVLHDIGKLFVPEAVLASSRPLTAEGWTLMKRHTTHGQEFLNGHHGFSLAATIARHHHERWDGSGYPDGLVVDQIPEAATIVSVADAFDAMTSQRRYRKRLSLADAVKEIVTCSGSQFSPRVVEALLRLHKRGELRVPRRPAARAA
jgi:diguanylate cyclase (GGDEF)-like protein/PAS domain S-box-containing protein